MPLPKPKDNEKKKDFLQRCMSNKTMKSEFPDTDKRYAVCNTRWEKNSDSNNIAGVANSVYNQCKEDNGKDCAQKAIRVANSKVGKSSSKQGGDDVGVKTMKIPKKELCFTEDADIKLSTDENGNGSFSMEAYSGNIIKGRLFWGDLAIDVSGIETNRKRYPILEQHDLERKVGVANSKPSKKDNKLTFDKINLLKNDVAQEFKSNLDDGFPYQASMSITPLVIEELGEGQKADVNGFTMKGPGTVIRKSELKEASVCVFGADPNTGVAALSDEQEELTVSLVESENLEDNYETKNSMEEKSMTLKELKEQYPDLYQEIQNQLSEKDQKITELSGQVEQVQKERDDLKGETENLSQSVKDYESRVAKLEKAEALRRAQDIKQKADSIVDQKLSAYEIPTRLHSKVKKQVDHNQFVDENDVLDEQKFSESVENEVKEWAETLGELTSSQPVLGFGADDKHQDKTENEDALVNEMLSYVGVEEKVKQ